MASRLAQNTGNFYYGVDAREATSTVAGTGTITITGNTNFENLLTIATGTTLSSTANIESNEPARYIPGYELGFLFNTIFTPPTGDGKITGGLLDGADNGIFIGFREVDGEQTFGFGRIKDQTEYFIPQADFNADKADGTGDSKLTLDFTKGNLWRIRFGVGFKPPVLEVLTPSGNFLLLHKIEYPNSSDETFISTSFLNPCIKVDNGTTAENVIAKIASFNAYILDGNSVDVNNRSFSLGLNGTLGAGAYTRRNLVSFRNSGNFQGTLMPSAKDHKIGAKLNYLSTTLSNQNKPVTLEIILVPNDDVTGGTYDSVSSDSVLDYTQDATIDFTNASVIFATSLLKTDDKVELNFFAFDIGSLRPGYHAVFALTSDTTLALDYSFSNAWSERF